MVKSLCSHYNTYKESNAGFKHYNVVVYVEHYYNRQMAKHDVFNCFIPNRNYFKGSWRNAVSRIFAFKLQVFLTYLNKLQEEFLYYECKKKKKSDFK